ncbi:DUF2829 domain-containing protein [Anaerotignum sp.]|uniref:DUF2829 domain-containing protein n=1 Tax=Anaerotignum sp. TaxID=2039241 RepID=UPI0028A915FD|nr:DUF2829 domain-containing protein [Anaerotignum sp.]
MNKYIGTKIVKATPMSLNDAEEHLQRKIKAGNEEGYLIIYEDGYKSWSPKKAFEEAYHESGGMSFGIALDLLKKGCSVAREGWNGKKQYIQLATNISYTTVRGEIVNCEHEAIGNKAIVFVGTSGVQMGWLASQADMLAEDWKVLD